MCSLASAHQIMRNASSLRKRAIACAPNWNIENFSEHQLRESIFLLRCRFIIREQRQTTRAFADELSADRRIIFFPGRQLIYIEGGMWRCEFPIISVWAYRERYYCIFPALWVYSQDIVKRTRGMRDYFNPAASPAKTNLYITFFRNFSCKCQELVQQIMKNLT